MNNIYKVIWSKAKNCYVVASEIARSHTKSATGSGKIGGVTRRSLLASLMALSLLCGGWGAASASLEVVDQSGTAGTVTIYTKDEVDNALTAKGSAADVASNKTDIETLKTAVGNAGSGLTKDVADQKAAIAINTTNISTNKDDITSLKNTKLDTTVASATYATKTELNGKADVTALGEYAKTADVNTELTKKADKTYVDTEVGKKADKATTLTGYGITDAYTKGDVDDKLNAKADAANVFTKDQTYTRDQVNTKLADYAKSDDVYTKTDADAKFATSGALTTAKTELDQKIDNEIANRITSDTALDQKIDNEIANRITSDTALDQKIDNEIANRITSDTALDQKIDKEIQDRENAIKDTNDRTGGIARNAEKTQTTIEGSVKVDNQGNVKDVKGLAAETITTSGNADLKGNVILGTNTANTVTVNGNADFNEAVNMDKGLTVTSGDTTLKGTKVDGKLTVTDDADLKNTKVDGTLTTTGKATFQEAVEMDKGLTVTSGDTTLKGTKVDGKLTVTDDAELKNTKVDGTLTTTGKATFQEAVEMDKGLTVTSGDTTLKGKLTVTGESDLKNTKVDGTLGVTGATTLSGELTAEKNATFEKDVTVKGTTNLKDTTVDGDLKVTGTITTDKMIFGDKATNNYTEIDHGKVTSKNLVVDGAGQTISSSSTFNAEEHKVGFANSATGDQSFHKQTSDIIMDNVKDRDNSNNRTQTKTETKDIITDKDGNSSTTSQTASENKTYLKDKDGKNTNSTIDTAKGYDKTIKGENGETSTKQDELNITNTAQNGTITNEAQNIVNNATGDMTNTVGKDLTTTVGGNELHEVTGTKTENVKGKVTENYKGGQETTVTGDKKTTVTGKTTEEYKGGLETTVTGDEKHTVTGNQTTNVTGDISNTAKNITNEANETLTDKVGENTRVTTSTSITDTVGTTTNRKIEDGKITDTANDSTVTTENGKGTTFTKTDSTAYSTAAGAPTDTNIAGNHITTGRVDANELGVSDKDGDNTANLTVKAGEGVKASAGNGTTTGSLDVTAEEVGSSVKDADGKGSTFKQRIDAIMMESKDVSIKAEETLTNEAKVITNKASEVINNEAVNINNTATGIITSKASEIKNEANQLISNKVGENTWENMEDGKITTSIKNGTKQNLTQSDAEKTEHSVVNGSNSTVNKQTSEEITDAVTNGTTTNVTQNTATSSNNTIADTNGNANTVVSTVDGTKFTNTGANTAIGEGTVTDTTIKGNTITTGKVTMDYAEVMKNLGVRGNANIAGKTTTGELEVTGKSTLKGDVTMESNATVKKDLTVEGTTTTKTLHVTENATVGGTLDVAKKATFGDSVSIAKDLSVDGNATIKGDVTAKSYKVGDKTYISAAGINANDQKITNVADGSISEGSKDAVNGGQLYTVKNDLEGKVNKVGANAAAMANLHPMEFDPSSKWNIAAAIGNYGSETAAAIGAFYRPNDNVMVNLSTAFGTGENMVGGGVSVRLGKGGNKLSREETNALKAQVADLTARMDALLSVLNPNMSKDFPDVPENHWAYEAVSRLAGNDIVQGYPDGEFHGERTMTRYEMAEIIYNALSRGAEAEKELVEEFKPELQAMAASEKATAEKAEG